MIGTLPAGGDGAVPARIGAAGFDRHSVADVGHLTDVFSFVPPSLLRRVTGLRQGEALIAGKVVPTPTFVRFGARVSEEGGSDVPSDWARGGA